jgi:DNA-binding MarR family transcriptional regulator
VAGRIRNLSLRSNWQVRASSQHKWGAGSAALALAVNLVSDDRSGTRANGPLAGANPGRFDTSACPVRVTVLLSVWSAPVTKGEQMAALTQAVRSVFNRLKALGDELHADLAITTAMRAVMETLFEGGPKTVPQIAKLKGVTRQHIQLLADALVDQRLAAMMENPAHKRSSLIALTEKGRRAFVKMRAREAPVIEELAWEFEARELERATGVLTRLAQRLEDGLKEKAPA